MAILGATLLQVIAKMFLNRSMQVVLALLYLISCSFALFQRTARVNNMHRLKSIGISNRIAELESLLCPKPEEVSELNGMLAKGDSYDVSQFTTEHQQFKAAHNVVLAKLLYWCSGGNVFVLDGEDGGSSRSLIEESGIAPSRIYVANRHKQSVDSLVEKALLPASNIILARAEDALQTDGALGSNRISFSCFYLDACGGQTSPLIRMIQGALGKPSGDNEEAKRMAIGFSILGGGKDSRSLFDKEMEVVRAAVLMAKRRGMVVSHVGDDPRRYGVSEKLRKVEGGTLTTWLALEPL